MAKQGRIDIFSGSSFVHAVWGLPANLFSVVTAILHGPMHPSDIEEKGDGSIEFDM